MKLYRIKNTVTGKYSKGGMKENWSKRGKFWMGKTDLLKHFRYLDTYNRFWYNKNCKVVEYEITENSEVEVDEFYTRE